jgi:hypothetical protein
MKGEKTQLSRLDLKISYLAKDLRGRSRGNGNLYHVPVHSMPCNIPDLLLVFKLPLGCHVLENGYYIAI